MNKMYVAVEINIQPDQGVEIQVQQLADTVAVLKETLVGNFDIEGVRLLSGDAAQELTTLIYSKKENGS